MNAETSATTTVRVIRRPAGLPTWTGANPERHARVVELRRSNAAGLHPNRRRDRARGVGKGGRAGGRAQLRSGRWDR